MKVIHLKPGTIVVFERQRWSIDTRIGGVYRLVRNGETKLLTRDRFKLYIPTANQLA